MLRELAHKLIGHSSLLGVVAKGGPVMIFLLGCSVIGLYIAIQKFILLRLNQVDHAEFLDKIQNSLLGKGQAKTIEGLKKQKTTLARVVGHALKLAHENPADIQEGIKSTLFYEIPKFEKNMSFLSSLITAAPMLGLVGSVLGLMEIFGGASSGDVQALAGGVAKALITTATGLSIAIPSIFIYNYLAQKNEECIEQIEHVANEVLRFYKSNQSEIKP